MFRSDWILARHGPLMLIPLLWLMAAMATTYPKFKSLKSFRQNPRMLRGQQVETASYSVEFEPHGSCKVLRACDPPCEITFPGWSRRSRPGMRSPMAVEAIKAICAKDLMDGSHPVLFARAVIVPNAPFQKLLAVANLRKLLKTHLPENFKNVMEAGSTLYRLDVDGSDHDIEVVFKNIPDDQQIVDLLLAGMTAAQLDAQQRVSGFKTKSKDYHELAAARFEAFDYGVQIYGYPKGTQWDVVATKWASHTLRYQFDVKQGKWKPMLSSFIKPIMEDWWKSKPKLFFGLKLLKMWNAQLPPLRCKEADGMHMVSPLSSFHIVLLAIAASKDWQPEMTLQDTCIFLLLFVQRHWRDATVVPSDIPTAEEHVQRIVAGYSYKASPQLKQLDALISESIIKLKSLSVGDIDEIRDIRVVEELFGTFANTLTDDADGSTE